MLDELHSSNFCSIVQILLGLCYFYSKLSSIQFVSQNKCRISNIHCVHLEMLRSYSSKDTIIMVAERNSDNIQQEVPIGVSKLTHKYYSTIGQRYDSLVIQVSRSFGL
jgi:hypothetical protein